MLLLQTIPDNNDSVADGPIDQDRLQGSIRATQTEQLALICQGDCLQLCRRVILKFESSAVAHTIVSRERIEPSYIVIGEARNLVEEILSVIAAEFDRRDHLGIVRLLRFQMKRDKVELVFLPRPEAGAY